MFCRSRWRGQLRNCTVYMNRSLSPDHGDAITLSMTRYMLFADCPSIYPATKSQRVRLQPQACIIVMQQQTVSHRSPDINPPDKNPRDRNPGQSFPDATPYDNNCPGGTPAVSVYQHQHRVYEADCPGSFCPGVNVRGGLMSVNLSHMATNKLPPVRPISIVRQSALPAGYNVHSFDIHKVDLISRPRVIIGSLIRRR